jgi:transcriptional regulator with XRE-family HTH domain
MSRSKKIPTARERIARNLRDWRLKRGMSQDSLCESAELSQTFLSQLENGLRNVSIDTLETLAEKLEIDILELLRV